MTEFFFMSGIAGLLERGTGFGSRAWASNFPSTSRTEPDLTKSLPPRRFLALASLFSDSFDEGTSCGGDASGTGEGDLLDRNGTGDLDVLGTGDVELDLLMRLAGDPEFARDIVLGSKRLVSTLLRAPLTGERLPASRSLVGFLGAASFCDFADSSKFCDVSEQSRPMLRNRDAPLGEPVCDRPVSNF